MENNYLMREDAPLRTETWSLLDNTMVAAAKSILTGRRLLHTEGPFGLGLKGVPLADPEVEVGLVTSQFLPLSIIRQSFTLARRDIAAYEQNGVVINTGPVARAAIECARLEDTLIFTGSPGVSGLMTAEGTINSPLSDWAKIGTAANDIIQAVDRLDAAGFHGPYTMALSPQCYNLLLRRAPNGIMNEMEHIKTIVTEGIIKSPAIEEGGILMASGSHVAVILLGQDMSISFIGPTVDSLQFTVSESLALLIRLPGAICLLKE